MVRRALGELAPNKLAEDGSGRVVDRVASARQSRSALMSKKQTCGASVVASVASVAKVKVKVDSCNDLASHFDDGHRGEIFKS